MQEPSQQQSPPKGPVTYRPRMLADFAKGIGNSASGYYAVAAGLGLVIGVATALTWRPANVPAPPQAPAALSSQTSGLSGQPAGDAVPAPFLLKQATNQKKTGANKRHGKHKLSNWKRGRKHSGAKRWTYVSAHPPSLPSEPTALQLAVAAAAAGPFLLGIQGDITVANYDAATGTIQTYEGQTYILDKTSGESRALPWQDYPFNAHYRCDGTGNCTIFHGGAVAAAKLTPKQNPLVSLHSDFELKPLNLD
jgi:hypothetical protein